jgi:hypothetical protein
MKKTFTVTGVALLFAMTAAATEWPKYEAYLGYDFVRFNPNSGFFPSFNANGGNGQFVYNFNKCFGGVVDVGAVTKGVLGGFPVDTTVLHFVAGPRITMNHEGRFVPFGQVLFGGAYGTTSARISALPLDTGIPGIIPPGLVLDPNIPISTRVNASNTGFAMMAGGGVDIKISKHMSFRPIGIDY